MIEIKAYGELRDGGFWPRNPSLYMQQIRDAGRVSDCLLVIKGSNRRTIDQNSYAHAVCHQIAVRMQQDGWEVSGYQVYKRAEENYCKEEVINEHTGRSEYFTKPLKEQPTDKFFEIIEQVRVSAMQRYPDIHISTPAEHYGLTEQAYDLWKLQKISYAEAKNMSRRQPV